MSQQNETIAIYKPYSQFSLDFSSKQKIHNLRKCLHHASSILSDTLEVVATIQTHESTLAGICNLPAPAHHAFQRELRNISSELRSHKQTTRKLLSLSKDTGSMVSPKWLGCFSSVHLLSLKSSPNTSITTSLSSTDKNSYTPTGWPFSGSLKTTRMIPRPWPLSRINPTTTHR